MHLGQLRGAGLGWRAPAAGHRQGRQPAALLEARSGQAVVRHQPALATLPARRGRAGRRAGPGRDAFSGAAAGQPDRAGRRPGAAPRPCPSGRGQWRGTRAALLRPGGGDAPFHASGRGRSRAARRLLAGRATPTAPGRAAGLSVRRTGLTRRGGRTDRSGPDRAVLLRGLPRQPGRPGGPADRCPSRHTASHLAPQPRRPRAGGARPLCLVRARPLSRPSGTRSAGHLVG